MDFFKKYISGDFRNIKVKHVIMSLQLVVLTIIVQCCIDHDELVWGWEAPMQDKHNINYVLLVVCHYVQANIDLGSLTIQA